jgi:hypothetical protein
VMLMTSFKLLPFPSSCEAWAYSDMTAVGSSGVKGLMICIDLTVPNLFFQIKSNMNGYIELHPECLPYKTTVLITQVEHTAQYPHTSGSSVQCTQETMWEILRQGRPFPNACANYMPTVSLPHRQSILFASLQTYFLQRKENGGTHQCAWSKPIMCHL